MGSTGAIPPQKRLCFYPLSCRYQLQTAWSVFASKTLGPNPNLSKLWCPSLTRELLQVDFVQVGPFPRADHCQTTIHGWVTFCNLQQKFTRLMQKKQKNNDCVHAHTHTRHRRREGAGLQRGSCVHCPAGWVEKLILPGSRNVSWQSVFLRCIYRDWKRTHGHIHAHTFDTYLYNDS